MEGRRLYIRLGLGLTGSSILINFPTYLAALLGAGRFCVAGLWATYSAHHFVRSRAITCGVAGVLDVDVNSLEALTRCDVLLIVPCTANMLAKIASGLPDDPVSLAVLSAPVPVAIAPAMHRQMWFSPATQRSVAKLVEYGHVIILPGPGKTPGWLCQIR